MHTGQSSQQMNQRLKNLEDQMELLIKLMESNNQLLRSIEEQQNREQFNTHMEQMEKYKEWAESVLNEPIPEDPDVKDED